MRFRNGTAKERASWSPCLAGFALLLPALQPTPARVARNRFLREDGEHQVGGAVLEAAGGAQQGGRRLVGHPRPGVRRHVVGERSSGRQGHHPPQCRTPSLSLSIQTFIRPNHNLRTKSEIKFRLRNRVPAPIAHQFTLLLCGPHRSITPDVTVAGPSIFRTLGRGYFQPLAQHE